MLFNPTQEQVRRFFCGVYAKSQAGEPLEIFVLLGVLCKAGI